MNEAFVLIGMMVVAIWSVETIDAFASGSGVRAFFAPATVIRKNRTSPMPDTSLGSPRWIVCAALMLLALALAALSLLPWTPSFRAGDSSIGVFLVIMLLDFVAVIVGTIGWFANRAPGVAALFAAILQLVAYGIVIGFGTIGPAMAAAGSDLGDERSHRFLDTFVAHVFALEKPGALVIASEVA